MAGDSTQAQWCSCPVRQLTCVRLCCVGLQMYPVLEAGSACRLLLPAGGTQGTETGLRAQCSSCQAGRLKACWPWLQCLQPHEVPDFHGLSALPLLAALVQAQCCWPWHHAVMSCLLSLSLLCCCCLRWCHFLRCSTSAHSSKTGASAGHASSHTSPPSKMSYSSIL